MFVKKKLKEFEITNYQTFKFLYNIINKMNDSKKI